MHPKALPPLDEHAIVITADDHDVWEALLEVIDATGTRTGAATFTRIVGCDDTAASGPRPLEQGGTIPGFRVAVADPARRLLLAGRHRFASYELEFHIDRHDACATQLRAASRARFLGPLGWVYGRLLVWSGMHVRVVRSLLTEIRRRAERTTGPKAYARSRCHQPGHSKPAFLL